MAGLFRALFGMRPEIRTVERSRDAGIDQDYRFARDPEHLIRFRQEWPQGVVALSAIHVKVVGISQPALQRTAIKFINGTARAVLLVRDPENPVDRDAIAVFGQWTNSWGMERVELVGYVPGDIAEEIADEHPDTTLYATLESMSLPRPGKWAGLRILIGCAATDLELLEATLADLIECPDCGREISLRAESCPGCGCPIVQVLREPPVVRHASQPVEQRSAVSSGFEGCFGVLLAIIVIIAAIWLGFTYFRP